MKEAPPRAARVLLSDGDREIYIGQVTLDPSLAFNKFQFVVSDMVGASPHQIALSLVRNGKVRASADARRKVPIDEGSDFGSLAREKDCVVLAQLKRARRERRGRSRRGHGAGGGDDLFLPEKNQARVPEKTILRRPAKFFGGASTIAGMLPAADDAPAMMGLFNYEGLRNLQLQRERYLLSTAAAALYPYAGAGASPLYGPDPPERPYAAERAVAVCDVCTAAREKPPPFHFCVHDRVVAEGFRCSVGPIERPRDPRLPCNA